jgi:predicted DNA-binding protein
MKLNRHPAKPLFCSCSQMILRLWLTEGYDCFSLASRVNQMSEKLNIEPTAVAKTTRSVRLDPELDEQLLLVCKTLGVNPNAYLRQVVGEAINRHLSQYRIEQGVMNSVNAQMERMFELMQAQESKEDQ